ncbi:MAG: D-alanine--D-alanine ligase [Treponema sp.]|jgi:D-alanine-D-alanine ligase|nr:D-alanine--D-alanine ligase [Treponema sp.]
MAEKLNIGILFGGKSAEHEVSLQSAKNVFDAINREKYNPILIGIDKTGRWLLKDESKFLLDSGDPRKIRLDQTSEPVALVPECGGRISRLVGEGDACKLDVIFPILHGPFGEDGTVQGLLKLADIPFVGAGVLGSAAGMDKDVMKRLLRDGGVPIGAFISLRSHEAVPGFGRIVKELGLPFFVKPANMGSSVGVSKVHDEGEYMAAVRDAFVYDRKIILEEFIKGREIECAVLGNEEPKASIPGEVISSHEFYSYDAKYLDENGAALEIPARLPPETVREIQGLAIKTFKVLECEGLGRVDFFLREAGPGIDGKSRGSCSILVNEINTMPGFTRISMYPKLWGASGISYTDLIDSLITLAVKRYDREKRLKTTL